MDETVASSERFCWHRADMRREKRRRLSDVRGGRQVQCAKLLFGSSARLEKLGSLLDVAANLLCCVRFLQAMKRKD